MDDMIYRQAAIDAIEHITSSMSVCINTDECHGMKRMQRQAIIELANLQSAQPKIVMCKYCKYYVSSGWCEGIGTCVSSDDFCSRAERVTNGIQ